MVLASDGLDMLGTVGVLGPAAVAVVALAVVIWRDRHAPHEDDEQESSPAAE